MERVSLRLCPPTAVLIVLLLAVGCSPECHLTQFTPAQFPSNPWALAQSVEVRQDEFWQLMDVPGVREGLDDHRFMLLVESRNCDQVKGFITVNGSQYPMTAHERGLWTYEPPDRCHGDYTYYYQVECGSPRVIAPGFLVTLGSASSPFTTTVQEWGNVGWFVSGEGSVHTARGDVKIGSRDTQTIIVRSMRAEAVQVERIAFYPDETAADNEKFEIRDLPALPATLRCGESLQFNVFWNSQAGDWSDEGTIEIFAWWPDPITPGRGIADQMYVHLRGYVVP